MKRIEHDDGTLAHEFNATQKRAILGAIKAIDEAAFWHRETDEGKVLASVVQELRLIHAGESLVAEPPEEQAEE